MHDPVAALRDAYGSTPDTSTLRGLTHYLEKWLAAADNAPTRDLVIGCKNMCGVLAKARLDTEADLKKSGAIDESLAQPIRESMQAYGQLRQVVAELVKSVAAEDRPGSQELLEDLKTASQELSRSQQAMDDWLNRPVLRCPGCGATGPDPCPRCELELVYADAGDDAAQQTATLPAHYGNVYHAYQAVMNAEKSLSSVAAPLEALQTHLRNLLAMTNSSLHQSGGSDSLEGLAENLEQILEGTARMSESLESRRLHDLRQGWAQVFQGALDHERIKGEVVHEMGGDHEKAMLQAATPPPTQDSITLSGE